MNPAAGPNPSPPQVLEGSCHCGAVRFQVQVKANQAVDCNCSICQKKGFLHLLVPPEQFQLLQGEANLTPYTFNTGTAQHLFCKTCGIHPFYRPRSHPEWFDVNLRCIDNVGLQALLAQFQLQPFDGRHWEEHIQELRGATGFSPG